MAETTPSTTPYRESMPGTLIVPLRSDPRWLRAGLFAVALGSTAIFMLYFRLLAPPRPPLLLALLPGLAVATFAGSALAWWGRRRGGTLALEASDVRLLLREPRRREELVDRATPFGAMILADSTSPLRVLVLSQHGEPVMLLDAPAGRGKTPAAPSASPGARWAERVVTVDLSPIAVSPASAHVLTLTVDQTLDPLLTSLDRDLTDDAPLLSFPLPSGEILVLHRNEIRVGRRAAPLGPNTGTQARRISVALPQGGELTALSLTAGEITLLLACQDPGDLYEGAPSDTPDAYLPPLIFAAVAQVVGAVPAGAGDAEPARAEARRG